ncbi:ABL027Wp [Eremothecium gossypii ATCC 10895]|uniref:ABL027Wp n=1 Tax=Eremothecium gossypii (strain ATCC 10895 / CBS 109.51 / FGSC 9923 / NRRL Y-1056) TaxID=284811 RepID=Q75DP4_EREGS|nr:ABL027Wp [Eremothecium gossypii ATCC 10895]AAS50744.1 ABL027Wp [Eremothecium gossypii ATCC 10895]AEY95033.1 FABL027Wp [Eremothecium gossypii FDAG1]
MMSIEKVQKRSSSQDLPLSSDKGEGKKRKVEFADGLVHSRHRNELADEQPQDFSTKLYKGYIRDALDDLETSKDTGKLDTIANQLSLSASSPDRISAENFAILLEMLGNNITKIDNKRGVAIVRAVLNFEKWWDLPPLTLGNYVFFLQILCSSIPKWWQDVSMLLISNFRLPVDKTTKHHEILKYFLRAIPSSSNFIDSYIAKYFPNKNDSKKNLVNYISNVLTLTEYCEELRFQAWSMIIEKIIAVDVELQNELDELDDDVDEEIDDKLADSDDGEDELPGDDDAAEASTHSADDTSFDSEDEQLEGNEEYNIEVTRNIKELSKKLDVILSMLTTRLSDALTPETLESGEGVNTFNTLVSLFKSHILPTYYTRSVQYLMFHVSQQQPQLMDAFLVTLIDIAFSPNETMEKKIKSLQYLGSFIARAKKLTHTQITFVASYLTSWLNRYVLEREEEVDLPGGMDRFKHFYAAFQALCYIFCFRHALFRDGNAWECDIDAFFQRTVISKFNPLKYCNENVMLMFARIAQHEGIVYCFSIIENNNNERLRGIMGKSSERSDGLASATGAASTWSLAARQQFIDLQSYFPYDPLFLKQYKNLMRDYYIEWSEISADYESDDSNEFTDAA